MKHITESVSLWSNKWAKVELFEEKNGESLYFFNQSDEKHSIFQ